MSARLEGLHPTTVRHNVGTCPACREYLWAEVDLSVTLSEPFLTADSRAHVSATAVVEAMRLSHECSRSDGDDS